MLIQEVLQERRVGRVGLKMVGSVLFGKEWTEAEIVGITGFLFKRLEGC